LLVDYVGNKRIERLLLSLENKGLVERVGDNFKMTEEGIKVAEELRRQENKKE
jgi:predicted transcriptional regulator